MFKEKLCYVTVFYLLQIEIEIKHDVTMKLNYPYSIGAQQYTHFTFNSCYKAAIACPRIRIIFLPQTFLTQTA